MKLRIDISYVFPLVTTLRILTTCLNFYFLIFSSFIATKMSQLEHVTVGIVGAGISGLTLAKMLELLGISYVLWEARSAIDEAAGAGVGLMPNGLRILDQLGLFEDIHKHHSPHHSWEYRDSNGTVYQTLTAMKALKTE